MRVEEILTSKLVSTRRTKSQNMSYPGPNTFLILQPFSSATLTWVHLGRSCYMYELDELHFQKAVVSRFGKEQKEP